MNERLGLQRAVLHALWADGLPTGKSVDIDTQGWNSDHPYLTDAIDRYRPGLVIEIGVWKGASVITLANRMRDLGCDGCVLAVDTWLGSAEHWLHDEIPRHPNGTSALYDLFRSNVLRAGLDDYVVPLPLDAQSAATVIKAVDLRPVVLHLDGSHDLASVTRDLEAWWPLIQPGGMLIVDDYDSPDWPDVKRAVDGFFLGVNIESEANKGRMVKG